MPLAAMLPAACTTPTRICCSCCSDQSAAPASAAGTAAASPAPTSCRDAFSAPPVKSRMLADSHAPAETWTRTGCTGWPSQTPCSASRTFPGLISRATR